MRAYSMSYFKQNAEKIVEDTVEDCDETIITLDNGEAVVIIPMREYSSWKETEYLLSNPANAKHLRKSIEQYRSGQCLNPEAFNNLRPSDS